MARGVSTVLDVAVCLLVVGAAVATLASIPPAGGDDAPDADATARLLATGTVAVPADDGTGHATYGAHLARGAVSAATVEDRRLLETPYPAAVRQETANATGDRTFVTARWEPYPDAVDADVGEPVTEADVEAANAALAEALAERLTADLRERYRSPEAAAADVTVDEVTVVVRRWEP